VPKTSATLRAEQDEAFLAALGRTGNARLAARSLGVNRSTYTKRRARDPAFAARWDAELAACHSGLVRAGGIRRPEGSEFRTAGGEPHVVRTAGGRLQRRLAPPGRLTVAAEQAVLEVIEATNNLRLAADMVGAAVPTLLARARASTAAARALRIARRVARDRVWLASRCGSPLLSFSFSSSPPPPPPPEDTAEGPSIAEMIHQVSLAHARERGRLPGSRRARIARLERIDMEDVARHIIEVLAALRRSDHFERTGRWRYDGEE
jgi:hypothetical protein